MDQYIICILNCFKPKINGCITFPSAWHDLFHLIKMITVYNILFTVIYLVFSCNKNNLIYSALLKSLQRIVHQRP